MNSITIQVNASGDDAVKRYAPVLYLPIAIGIIAGASHPVNSRRFCTGMIFRSVNIAQGSNISTATLEVKANIVPLQNNSDVKTRLRAYDADDVLGGFDLSTEGEWDSIFPGILTTAQTDWDFLGGAPNQWDFDIWYFSPDISAVIQEIVDRPGWVSGNDMIIFWDDYDDRSTPALPSANAARQAHSYSHAAADAPKLNISFIEPSIGQMWVVQH